ncbi:hypothetical protein RJ640_011986 [Escallonia rubra]|uniref:CCHC-type domain-containing protein n=1 Tax=Escallonia rubra TaxID=112253 RepID=A0AA88SA90_9ASTE|nr:hypothetical protein RJ640_011986 [Escallonia rubra]
MFYPKEPPLRAVEAAIETFDHFVKNDKLTRSTLLTFMEPDLEVIYEEYKTTTYMFDAVTEAYGTTSNTYIQLLIEKYNGNPIPDKIQVSTVLSSLLDSWDPVVISINVSSQDLTMKILPMLLELEAERRVKKKKNESHFVTPTSTFNTGSTSSNAPDVFKPNSFSNTLNALKPRDQNFKNRGRKFQRGNGCFNKKLLGNCYTCGKPGHHRNNCPQNKDGNIKQFKKGPGDIVCVVSESLLADCDSQSWWVDSVSSRHVAKTRKNFVEMRDVKASDHKLSMGNNMYCDVLGVGTVKILLPGQNNLILTDVLYVPNMRRNLLYVPRMDEKGFELRFRSSKVSIGKHGCILVWGVKVDGLYRLNTFDVSGSSFVMLSHYVDDILLPGNNLDKIIEAKDWLRSQFKMKDMGEASYVLDFAGDPNDRKSTIGYVFLLGGVATSWLSKKQVDEAILIYDYDNAAVETIKDEETGPKDPLTKAIATENFKRHVASMGLYLEN